MSDAGNQSFGVWPPHSGAVGVPNQAGRASLLWPPHSGAVGVPNQAGRASLLWPPHSGAVGVPVQAGCRSYLLWPLGVGCITVAPPPPPPPEPPAVPPLVFGGGGRWDDKRVTQPGLAPRYEDELAVLLAVVQFVLIEDEAWELLPTV